VRLVRLVKNGAGIAVNIPRELLRERGWQRGDQFLLELIPDGFRLRRCDDARLARAIEIAIAQPAPARGAR
jgi:hypothetical protein